MNVHARATRAFRGPRGRIGALVALLRDLRSVPRRLDALEGRLTGEVSTAHDDVAGLRAQVDEVVASVAESGPRFAELRDSVHLVARRTALRRRPTRVLFLVHMLGTWSSYHDLVEAMVRSDDFVPVVVSTARRFRGSNGLYGEEEVHRGLTARGVAHLRLAPDDLDDALSLIKAIDPDLIFRQSQWDDDVPDELATSRLGFARTCLIPYETMNIVVNVEGERTPNTAVDSDYHRAAWLVFCTNELMLDAAVRDGAREGSQFRVVGHPKADRLRRATPSWPVDGPAPGGRVVWSAHHTIGQGWTDFGAFHVMRDEMLAWARRRADVHFVFMPHPALLPFPDSDDSPISRAEFDGWTAAWSALPNTAVVSETEYGPTLAASDVMVTDGLSMLVEYQLFTKPVIFFDRDGHRPFNAIGERVALGVHPVRTVPDARRLAEEFLDGQPDPLRDRQQENARELFGVGESVARILAVLRREIAHERGDTG